VRPEDRWLASKNTEHTLRHAYGSHLRNPILSEESEKLGQSRLRLAEAQLLYLGELVAQYLYRGGG
jgi:hypothetical protein